MSDPIRQAVDVLLDGMNEDELRVVGFIAARLTLGRADYGPLDVESDGRDFGREIDEEAADLLVYAACLHLKTSAGRTG